MIVSKKKYEKLRLRLEQSEKDLGDLQMDFSVQIDKALEAKIKLLCTKVELNLANKRLEHVLAENEKLKKEKSRILKRCFRFIDQSKQDQKVEWGKQ